MPISPPPSMSASQIWAQMMGLLPTAYIVRARYFLDRRAKEIGRFTEEAEAQALVREKRVLFVQYWDRRQAIYPEIVVEPVYT